MALFTKPTKQLVREKKLSQRELIKLESEIGATIFGPIPKGHRREFFCLDEHTWVWFEEWKDASGKKQNITTRYEVSSRGVLKVQGGSEYQMLQGEEAKRFIAAVSQYYQRVSKHIYDREV